MTLGGQQEIELSFVPNRDAWQLSRWLLVWRRKWAPSWEKLLDMLFASIPGEKKFTTQFFKIKHGDQVFLLFPAVRTKGINAER